MLARAYVAVAVKLGKGTLLGDKRTKIRGHQLGKGEWVSWIVAY